MLAATNTYGAYLYKATGTCAGAASGGWGTSYSAPCWEQLFTATSIQSPSLTIANGLNQGVLEAVSCNNNTSDAYAFFNGNLWVTTNLKAVASSRVWSQTPLTNAIGGNQGISAGTGPAIACDPANPNLVYAGVPGNLKVTSNGLSGASASFANVSGVGTTGTLPSLTVFDPESSTGTCSQFSGTPACTLHFWVFTDGTGVYETYNGGSSFTKTTSGPTTASGSCGQGGYCFRMQADQFSQLWAAIGDAKLYKYIPNGTAGSGTWSSSTPGVLNSSVAEFAIDPSSGSAGSLRIAASGPDGSIALTTNGGSSWTGAGVSMTFSASGTQPPWLGNANQASGGVLYLANQDMIFDGSGNLWSAGGIGVWETASASVAVNGNWAANSIGIEQLVTDRVASASGNSPVLAFWDRAFFLSQNPDVFPSRYWPDYIYSTSYGPINGGWALDFAAATQNFFTGWAGQNNVTPAYSSDGGTTWTIWANSPSPNNIGGAIAASTTTNWVAVPAASGSGASDLWYTTNGASSAWQAATISGETTPYTNGTGYGFPIAADSVTANAFCLIDSANNIFASTNSGANWTLRNSGTISGIKYNDALKAVPGQSGVFYYSGGNAGGGSTGFHLWKITKTTNECDTATDVNSSITNIYGFGYGAPLPGGNGFPTIYFYGEYNSVLGLYEIDNGGTTPTLINVPSSAQTWPNNSVDFVKDVSGDMNVYGRIYVGFNGSGAAYIDTAGACPWVNFSNTKPTAALTGTVSLQAQQSGLVPVISVSFYVDISTLIGTQTSGSGTPTTFTQSWVTGGVSHGAHTLTVTATGNGCSGSFTIPITTSYLLSHDLNPANDNNAPAFLNEAA